MAWPSVCACQPGADSAAGSDNSAKSKANRTRNDIKRFFIMKFRPDISWRENRGQSRFLNRNLKNKILFVPQRLDGIQIRGFVSGINAEDHSHERANHQADDRPIDWNDSGQFHEMSG